MKKVVLTVLKIAGIVLLVLILLIAGFLFWLSRRPFVPNDYTETVETGGALEAKYLAMGPYEVKQVKAEAPEDWKEFVAYYPAQLEDSGDQWPAVVFVNGTGVYASRPVPASGLLGLHRPGQRGPRHLLRRLHRRHSGLAAGAKRGSGQCILSEGGHRPHGPLRPLPGGRGGVQRHQ